MDKKPKKVPPRRCSKADCNKKQPCPDHPWGWEGYRREDRYKQYTGAERRLMQSIKEECGYKCYKCGRIDSKGQTDHIINRARGGKTTRDNLQFLCKECHNRKTHKESRMGMKRRKNGK